MDGARQLVAREPQRPELARLYERRWVGAGEPVVRQIQMPQSGDLAVMGGSVRSAGSHGTTN